MNNKTAVRLKDSPLIYQEITQPCLHCEDGIQEYWCYKCNGSGEGMSDGYNCSDCHGWGSREVECDDCDGRGWIYVEVEVPAYV